MVFLFSKLGRLVFQKQKPKRVKAVYNCVADNADELTFAEGEVIVVDGEEDQEWWVGTDPLFVPSVYVLPPCVTVAAVAESHDPAEVATTHSHYQSVLIQRIQMKFMKQLNRGISLMAAAFKY